MRVLEIGDKLRNRRTNEKVKIMGAYCQQIPWIYLHSANNKEGYAYHDADYFDEDWELIAPKK